jgi:hypothetical protein
MTIIDYLVVGGFAAAALYTGYRLLLGWLRTPPHEIESETPNISNRSTVEPSARERELALEAAAQIADMPSQMR